MRRLANVYFSYQSIDSCCSWYTVRDFDILMDDIRVRCIELCKLALGLVLVSFWICSIRLGFTLAIGKVGHSDIGGKSIFRAGCKTPETNLWLNFSRGLFRGFLLFVRYFDNDVCLNVALWRVTITIVIIRNVHPKRHSKLGWLSFQESLPIGCNIRNHC